MMRPFKVLGIQQIAIGGADKHRLAKLWVEMLGLEVTGTFRSDRENVDDVVGIARIGGEAIPVLGDGRRGAAGLGVDDHEAVPGESGEGVPGDPEAELEAGALERVGIGVDQLLLGRGHGDGGHAVEAPEAVEGEVGHAGGGPRPLGGRRRPPDHQQQGRDGGPDEPLHGQAFRVQVSSWLTVISAVNMAELSAQ